MKRRRRGEGRRGRGSYLAAYSSIHPSRKNQVRRKEEGEKKGRLNMMFYFLKLPLHV